jgi:hypothetical protein
MASGQRAGQLLATGGFVQAGCSRQQQGHAQCGGHDFLHGWVSRAYFMQEPQRGQRSGDAASAQCTYDAPRDQALTGQADGAPQFGEGSKQQVSAHGQVRFDTEKENEDGCHQRATTHTRQTDDEADRKSRKNESYVMHGRDCSHLSS